MSIRSNSILFGLILFGFGMNPSLSEESFGCDDIHWKQQLLVVVDDMEQACQEVVVRRGESYVRFEAEFVRLSSDGDAQVLMVMQDGTRVERSIRAPSDFHVLSYSGKTNFHLRDLSRGDILDVFIPLSRVVAVSPE